MVLSFDIPYNKNPNFNSGLNVAILDFNEIPPAQGESRDLEAFEKFAKDFFVRLYGAEIEKTVARGPDGGADLVIDVNGEKWLISCKHYPSGSPIPPGKEEDPAGRLEQWGCKKFVGFYNPGPSTGLEQKIRQTREKKPSHVFEIMDNEDIERELIATASSEGWLLAMRWFPKSFAQIASSLVMPLRVYSKQSVVRSPGQAFVPGMHVKGLFREGDEAASAEVVDTLTEHANETATMRAFSGIFHARVLDFARLIPLAFVKPVYLDDKQLTPRSVFPSWDLDLIRELVSANNRVGLVNLCRVWSLWGMNLARTAYTYGLLLLQNEQRPVVQALSNESSILSLRAVLSALPQAQNSVMSHHLDGLTFSHMATDCFTIERGFFAALLCFCPGGLSSHIKRTTGIVELAYRYGELNALEASAKALAETFSPGDQLYVQEKSKTFIDLLVSLEFIQSDALDELARRNSSLRCLSAPLVEAWSPNGNPPPYLGKAMGF
ncbi:restriction endonuclease [Burkholderia cepacia]